MGSCSCPALIGILCFYLLGNSICVHWLPIPLSFSRCDITLSLQNVNAFETFDGASSSSDPSADSVTGRPPVFSWGGELSKHIEPHRPWQFHGVVRDGFSHVE